MTISLKRILIRSLFFLLLFSVQGNASQQELKQYSAAIHVHSSFSNGEYEILELARFAKERNIDVLALTDSFLTSVTYGIWPFDRIGLEGINKRVRLGVRDHGVDRYFEAVREAQRQFPDLVILPGVEVTPHYYWTGLPWTGLKLYDFDHHFTIFGLTEQQIANLPVIGNEKWGNTQRDWTLIAVPLAILLGGMLLLYWGTQDKIQIRQYTIVRRHRHWATGTVLLLFSFLLLWNNYPFGKFGDPHSGRSDTVPFQGVIDYVRNRGGIIYWSYPEAVYPNVIEGGGTMVSEPHSEDLILTDGYHGFEGIYGNRISATRPGNVWDMVLMRYIDGWRRTAPRVITGIDFHYFKGPGGSWYDLNGGQTFFLMEEKSHPAVLDALRKGSGYATFQEPAEELRLYDFSVETFYGVKAFQGDEVEGEAPVRVHIDLDWAQDPPANNQPFQLELIRNAEVVLKVKQFLPIEFTTTEELQSGRHYFRIRAAWPSKIYEVLSNPIFVSVP
jgi:hypothetical protein